MSFTTTDRHHVGPRGAAAALCVLLLSACGSGHATPRVPPGARGPTVTSHPTPAPIPIGTICSCQGALAGAPAVLEAWVALLNNAGGLEGHPLQLFSFDDHGSAAESRADVAQLVNVDHAVAIVGEASTQSASWTGILATAKVPVVGGIPFPPGVATSTAFYPSGATVAMEVVGAVALARQAGADHLGVLTCGTSAECQQLTVLADGAGALLGMRKVTHVLLHSGPGGLQRTCGGLRALGVNALLLASSEATARALVGACASIEYTPQLVGVLSQLSPDWLGDPHFDGMLLAGANADPYDTALPGIRAFRAALRTHAPQLLAAGRFSYQLLGPWAGAQLFAAAVLRASGGKAATPTAISPSAPTAAEIQSGLDALRGQTLGGVAPALRFTAGHPALVPCYFSSQIALGQLLSLRDDAPRCLPSERIGALLEAISP
jgi:branched-chain amino acid transport system substrate-binding protein